MNTERIIMKNIKNVILTLVIMLFANIAMANEQPNLSADEALLKLKQGNEHFVHVHMKHPDETKHRREEMIKGQHPFVAILSCSDSRVPSEIIFDQGLGDIFVIRNAGNVLDDHIIGSIEYAVLHLGIKLVVIMGHQECGAVKAAMSDTKETKYIESLKKSIEPAVCKCKKCEKTSIDDVSKTHAKLDVEELLQEDCELCEYMKSHKVKVIPAYYHLDTGVVEFLN
jgi:carbonic anhydrase